MRVIACLERIEERRQETGDRRQKAIERGLLTPPRLLTTKSNLVGDAYSPARCVGHHETHTREYVGVLSCLLSPVSLLNTASS